MTIFWSFSVIKDELAKGNDGEFISYLGDQEREYLSTLRFEKRRSEWLAGRLAMKRLLQASYPEFSQYEPRAMQILKAENGAPHLLIERQPHPAGKISLSHSNGYVLCAYSNDATCLGVDLERIEPRPQEFVQDFFTQDEIDQVSLLPAENHPLSTTLIWSAKEAVLKALSLGLKVDTRKINISLESSKYSGTEWNSLRITTKLNEETLRLYWRRENEFVLTVCVEQNQPTRFVCI